MSIRSKMMTALLASTLSFGGGSALAQDTSPQSSPETSPVSQSELITIDMLNVEGNLVGSVTISERDEGVNITVQSISGGSGAGFEPGEHGIHIHEMGVCDPSGETPFESAGGHFNPTDAAHGGLEDEDSHAGDLGNLTVEETGTFGLDVLTGKVTLDPEAENSLAGPNGSAIVIHANEDDLETDPSGESGERIACGVIFAPEGSGATPPADGSDATPEATPLQ